MPVKPTSAGTAPRSAAIACRACPAIDRAGVGLRGVGPCRRSGTSDRRRDGPSRSPRPVVRTVRAPAAGSVSPGTMRRSMTSSQRSGTTLGALPPVITAAFTLGLPTSGCSRSGSTSGEPQHQPSHRRDRVHAQLGLGAVRRRASRGRGDPRAASLGQPDPEVARLADDARVLHEHAAIPQHLGPVDAHVLLVGGEVERQRARQVDAGATDRRGGGERGGDRTLHVGGAAADQSAVLDHALPRPVAPSSTGRRRARRPGARSTRGRGVRPTRTTPRRSAGLRRSGPSRVTPPIAVRMSDGHCGGGVLGTAGVLAGCGDQGAREREDLVRVDRRRGCLGEVLIYHGARWYPSPRCERRCAPRSSRTPSPSPAPAGSPGGRPRAVRRGAGALARLHRPLERHVAPRR